MAVQNYNVVVTSVFESPGFDENDNPVIVQHNVGDVLQTIIWDAAVQPELSPPQNCQFVLLQD